MNHYQHSALDEKTVCGLPLNDAVKATSQGDDVDCKNCRRRFVKRGAALFYEERWTQCCSGCCSAGENESCGEGCGSGCHECGYTGKRLSGFWAPINPPALASLGIS